MMDVNNSAQEIVYTLLEKLKANGTFDEFRRFCVSDIDAKSAYQNWKQRIETSALKFLSQVEYTPELNKNIIWEKMRKHLLDGHETQDISDGADRILNQLLGPRTLDAIEPKILKVVNEYLGNENGPVKTEVNGLNEFTICLKKVSENDNNASFKPKLEFISNIDNMENIEETSPEFEPLTSVYHNNDSDDESVSGMSDLLSVGSPVQIVSKESNDTCNSTEFETNKNIIEDSQQSLFDKNGMINHKNKNTDNESNNTNLISNNSEKLKSNDLKSKSKHHSSKESGHSSSQNKSSSHRSKNRNSNSHRSTSQEKNDTKKRSDSSSKDKKSSSHSKHHSNSKDKDKKNKHKKSHHSDRDKTPKRDRKDSRSDKKEKSSSLCKEPKSLNGNRSDDESNAGGSSKQKGSVSKNKSSTSEKSKSSSSNHKTSRKDNSKDVNKSKDKSSLSLKSYNLSQINNQNKKRHKKVLEEETDCPVIKKKIKLTNDQDSSMTDDNQDAAKVFLAMSSTSFDIYQNEIKIVNTICDESSSVDKTLNTTAEKHIETKEYDNPVVSRTTDNIIKENTNSIEDSLKLSPPLNSIDNASVIDKPKVSNLSKDVYAANIKHPESSLNKTTKIYSEFDKHIKSIVSNKKINSNTNLMTDKHDSNTILSVSNPKLLPNQIDVANNKRCAVKIATKVKKTKSLVSSRKVDVPVINNTSKTVIHKQNDKPSKCDVKIKINDSLITPKNTLNLDNENSDSELSNIELSTDGFKGFSPANIIPCDNRHKLQSYLRKFYQPKSPQNLINDGFKGFDVTTAVPCLHRNLVYLQYIKETRNTLWFKGFKKEEIQRCAGYKYVKNHLEVLEIKNNQQKTITNGENGILSQETFNKVMAIVRENEKDKKKKQINCTKTNDTYSQPNSDTKKDCPVVNNNNHDITPSNHWVVEQEMKYKLLPVKVKLERLMEYRSPNTKPVSHSSKVSSTTQRKKID